jgi:hypothetical protein
MYLKESWVPTKTVS